MPIRPVFTLLALLAASAAVAAPAAEGPSDRPASEPQAVHDPPTQALLDDVQRAGAAYFYDFGHPVSGLARESSDHHPPDVCAIGATGMGCFNLMVAAERGFTRRAKVAERVRLILRFLEEKADRFHGALPHWLDGRTGKTVPFSPDDDGADLVETAYLAQGLLALREYFTADDPVEAEIRTRADRLWRDIEWDFFVKEEGDQRCLLWHWSPRVGFQKNHAIRGFNECHIVYVLALASPTHPAPAACYRRGWHGPDFSRPREHFTVRVTLGGRLEMPLFFTHYSYLGLDPRAIRFQGRTYFQHFQDLCRVQVRYAESKRDTFAGYGPLWGLTASLGPDGYRAFAPGADDNGTIAPTAALSSMPYVPRESMAFLTELRRNHAVLWGPHGFVDAFNLSRGWQAKGYLGIDVGPIAPMIENHRTGLCWKTFMKASELAAALRIINQANPREQPAR